MHARQRWAVRVTHIWIWIKLKQLLHSERHFFHDFIRIVIVWLMAECRKMRMQMHVSLFLRAFSTDFAVAVATIALGVYVWHFFCLFLPQKAVSILLFTCECVCVRWVMSVSVSCICTTNDVRIVRRHTKICMLKCKRTEVVKRAHKQ